jgi:hypothetical protein
VRYGKGSKPQKKPRSLARFGFQTWFEWRNKVVEIGPMPPVVAPEYLLKVHNSGGRLWVKTPIHTNPGSEALYVLTGKLGQRLRTG